MKIKIIAINFIEVIVDEIGSCLSMKSTNEKIDKTKDKINIILVIVLRLHPHIPFDRLPEHQQNKNLIQEFVPAQTEKKRVWTRTLQWPGHRKRLPYQFF